MRCGDVQSLASEYLDGHLDEARGSALRGHLHECEACHTWIHDLARVRDVARELPTLDPSPALWSAIERGLADAEIADAHRSRFWLGWQALRPRLLPAAVVVAAAAAVTLWLTRAPTPRAEAPAVAVKTAAPSGAGQPARARRGAAEVAPRERVLSTMRERQVAAADKRYLTTLTELRGVIDAERSRWSQTSIGKLDRALAEFAAEAARERRALNLAVSAADGSANDAPQGAASVASADAAPPTAEPRERDALYAVYRAEIALLQDLAIYGEDALARIEPQPNGVGAWPGSARARGGLGW